MYFNPLNPTSWDSNHAHILKIGGYPEKAIQEIKRFYEINQLTPRIYCSFLDNELEILRPYLEAEGFTVNIYDSKDMYFPLESRPLADSAVLVRRITQLSKDVIETFEFDWTIKVFERHLNDKLFHLLGLFYEGKCVSRASVKTMEGYSRVDDVATPMNYRGRHFGTKLMSYLVSYHASISDNYLYLWAHNPIAIRMYKNVGFKEIPNTKSHWTAFIK